MKHEKQIFRDCYNILLKYADCKMGVKEWESIRVEASDVCKKYEEDLDEHMLAAELMYVIEGHLDRRSI